MMGSNRILRALYPCFACLLVVCLLLTDAPLAFATEPEDNSPYDLPEPEEPAAEDEDEDLTGKLVITVRKPTDFKVYSKRVGVFVVEAKNKGEISGYDIRVRKTGSQNVKNYRAVTTKNLKRRFVGGKENDHYMVKVRTFRTINGKEYPSKWTKELQVIILNRDEDNTPSNTRLPSTNKASGKKKSKKKK